MKRYIDTLISESDMCLGYSFQDFLDNSAVILTHPQSLQPYFQIDVRRNYHMERVGELNRLLLCVITCEHVLRYYDDPTKINISWSLGNGDLMTDYVNNFRSFDETTSARVYAKYLSHKIKLKDLCQEKHVSTSL